MPTLLLLLPSRLCSWSWGLLEEAWLDTLSWEDKVEVAALHWRLGLPQPPSLLVSPRAGAQGALTLKAFSKGSEEEKT